MTSNKYRITLTFAGPILLALACTVGGSATAIPAGRPASFEIQTITPTAKSLADAPGEPEEAEPVIVVPLGDAPTHTPDPNATLPPPPPTLTPTPSAVTALEATVVLTATATLTPTVKPTPRPTPVPVEPDPPLAGGDWDFETEFIPWPNPHGEPCPGARVASGWTAFVEQGPYGSSCLNENLYQPNVQSGQKSQEITFDFIAANSGVFRTIPVKTGHRYKIEAYARSVHSLAPVQMFVGVDFSGGTDWSAESVEWFPWANTPEDTWNVTETTVTATGQTMTIFIRGFHPQADQGGKTVIDNVSVTDLGL
ncbi:MAG: hypothetical protein D6768_15425 [Chloroflexi bacterium]|nr:MAG: hypothetical protein D6768_15425 [Chloroflexota bacterium]